MTTYAADSSRIATPGIQRGEILHAQRCAADSSQHYDLYLPSYYTPDKRWPILFVFDPGARGSVPVALMKPAAEHYGYLLAASDNSRNGPMKQGVDAAQAMWTDTHRRLSIDDGRAYFAGFSGGARFAAALAQGCKCAKAVFLNGAGFPTTSSPSKDELFALFLTVGTTDFNYAEMLTLNDALGEMGRTHLLRRFEGPHQWAPGEVWEEALAWAELLAMNEGARSRDSSLVARELVATLKRADTLEQSGSGAWALQYLRSVRPLFHGLTDTKVIDERLALLETDEAVKIVEKKEQRDIEEQKRLESKVLVTIERARNPNRAVQASGQDSPSAYELRRDAHRAVVQLRENAGDEEDAGKRRLYERALAGIFAYLMESGQTALEQNDCRDAQMVFDLATEAKPGAAWPHVLLARCLARSGDREGTLKALGEARRLGLSAQDLAGVTKQVAEFSSLSGDPEFQKLLTEDSSLHPGE